MTSLEHPDSMTMLLLTVLVLGLATFTYHYIEGPFRHRENKPFTNRTGLFGATIAVSLGVVVLGLTINSSRGEFGRYDPQALAQLSADIGQDARLCDRPAWESTKAVACELGAVDADRTVAVVGDSHAAQWQHNLDDIGRTEGIRIRLYAKSACSIADIRYYYPLLKRVYSECPIWRNRVFDQIEEDRPDLVVLTHSSLGYVNADMPVDDYIAGLTRTSRRLAASGLRVLYLQDNPRFSVANAVRCAKRKLLVGASGAEETCVLAVADSLNPALRQREVAAFAGNGSVLDLSSAFCDDMRCVTIVGNSILMADSNHLSAAGLAVLKTPLQLALRAALQGR